jgi:predicted Rdx family selenoprotein
MPKYVIERDLPGAGKMTPSDLEMVAKKSCDVLRTLGPEIQWVESYVVDDKIYCVYISPDEKLIREHAKMGGFPANQVSEVRAIIDPTSSEGRVR